MFKMKTNKNIVCYFEGLFPNIFKCLNIATDFSVFTFYKYGKIMRCALFEILYLTELYLVTD